MTAQLVFLHGGIASGKLTTGRALAALTGLPLFHNHLVVDALLAVFPFGSPEFVRLREEFWLSTFAAAAGAGRSLVFTFAPEPTVPAGFPDRTRAAVEAAGGRVRFVGLRVSPAVQEARLTGADRSAYGKLTDVAVLRSLRGQPVAEPPAELVVDTDDSPPPASARRIAEALGLPLRG
ncbi:MULTISPECIES: hypothetical protein [unclassified Blastococcus]